MLNHKKPVILFSSIPASDLAQSSHVNSRLSSPQLSPHHKVILVAPKFEPSSLFVISEFSNFNISVNF